MVPGYNFSCQVLRNRTTAHDQSSCTSDCPVQKLERKCFKPDMTNLISLSEKFLAVCSLRRSSVVYFLFLAITLPTVTSRGFPPVCNLRVPPLVETPVFSQISGKYILSVKLIINNPYLSGQMLLLYSLISCLST